MGAQHKALDRASFPQEFFVAIKLLLDFHRAPLAVTRAYFGAARQIMKPPHYLSTLPQARWARARRGFSNAGKRLGELRRSLIFFLSTPPKTSSTLAGEGPTVLGKGLMPWEGKPAIGRANPLEFMIR